nr:lasso peptide biosynthesis B2 protein [Sphingorhabdus profundilacus]
MPFLENPDLAWCEINETLVFLDISKDRYFRLADDQNREALEAIDGSAFGRWHQPVSLTALSNWTPPARSCAAIGVGSFQLAEVARALWVQRRVERRLARQPFGLVIGDFRRVRDTRADNAAVASNIASGTICGFEHARLLRTAAERCLARSLALSLCLASRGVRAHVVLGVRLAPFSAHCWAQAGDEVLNDSVEEVLRYKPILFI